MYGYVYLTYIPTYDKFYIGQHKSPTFDKNYFGSGVQFLEAAKSVDKSEINCILIQECQSKEELNAAEQYWIDIYDAVNSPDFYNVSPGGVNCVYNVGLRFVFNEETQQNLMVPEALVPYFEEKGFRRGCKPRTPQQIQNLSDAKKQLVVMTNDEDVIYCKKDQVANYIDKGYRKGRIPTRPDQKKENRKWMNKDGISVMIPEKDIPEKLQQGYVFGRTKFSHYDRRKPAHNKDKVGISKDGKLCYVDKEEVAEYLAKGYVIGK